MHFPKYPQTITFIRSIVCLALLALAACVPGQPGSEGLPTAATEVGSKGEDIGEIPTRAPEACPGLDSTLYLISQAEEPLRMAEDLGLKFEGEGLQVILVLANEDAGFLKDYDVEVTTQSKNLVQAFVPPAILCDLANLDNVTAIQPPPQASLD